MSLLSCHGTLNIANKLLYPQWSDVTSNGGMPPIIDKNVILYGQGGPNGGSNVSFTTEELNFKGANFIEFVAKIDIVGQWFDNDFTDAGFGIIINLDKMADELTFFNNEYWCYNSYNLCYSNCGYNGRMIGIALAKDYTNIHRASFTNNNCVSREVNFNVLNQLPPLSLLGGELLKFKIDFTELNVVKIYILVNDIVCLEATLPDKDIILGNAEFSTRGSLIVRHHNYNYGNYSTNYVKISDSMLKIG